VELSTYQKETQSSNPSKTSQKSHKYPSGLPAMALVTFLQPLPCGVFTLSFLNKVLLLCVYSLLSLHLILDPHPTPVSPPTVWVGTIQPTEGQIEQKAEAGELILPDYSSWDVEFYLPWTFRVVRLACLDRNGHHSLSGSQAFILLRPIPQHPWIYSSLMVDHETSQPQ
jgi:hypothetical protein